MIDDALLEKIRANEAIEDTRRTIKLARVRCLPFDQLINRLRHLLTDDQSSEIVYVIIESPRSGEQDQTLALTLRELLKTADQTTARNREWLERRIGRILPTLPSDITRPIARECLSHRRKGRRTIGFRCLSLYVIDDEWSLFLLGRYDETGDDRFVKELLKHPIPLTSVNPRRLIKAFGSDKYWLMRVVEATLKQDRAVALSLAASHPSAFVWAAGRLGDAGLLPEIAHCFETANDKVSLIGVVAWAYGKLGAYEQLEALSPTLEELAQEHNLPWDNDLTLVGSHSRASDDAS